jgi:hypothetical protein
MLSIAPRMLCLTQQPTTYLAFDSAHKVPGEDAGSKFFGYTNKTD